MGSLQVLKIEPGPDASPGEKKAANQANAALLLLPKRIVGADPWFSIARYTLLSVVVLTTVGATAALIVSAASDATWAAVASAGAIVASMAIAGFINPLQTVERDIIVRRWSDVIISGWAADLGGTGTPRSATRLASQEFATLAAAYGVMTGKTLDALSAVNSPKADDAAAGETPKELTVSPIADQSSAQGEELASALSVEAKGGSGKYKYAIAGQPAGLEITASSGDITGTVAADADATESIVTVTVTEVLADDAAGEPQSKKVKFVWTVTTPAQ